MFLLIDKCLFILICIISCLIKWGRLLFEMICVFVLVSKFFSLFLNFKVIMLDVLLSGLINILVKLNWFYSWGEIGYSLW